ncbi:MAG: thiocyanate hydrolase [Mycobacterium sp.]
MTTSPDPRSIESVNIVPLRKIVERQQVWGRMAAEHGVDNPVPPWKSSLDGMCDALDQSACGADILAFTRRRSEEDQLAATVYADLPYPESQLVSLAHSLVVAGVIDEKELQERLASVRARLEA